MNYNDKPPILFTSHGGPNTSFRDSDEIINVEHHDKMIEYG
jgi:hypothetical protein